MNEAINDLVDQRVRVKLNYGGINGHWTGPFILRKVTASGIVLENSKDHSERFVHSRNYQGIERMPAAPEGQKTEKRIHRSDFVASEVEPMEFASIPAGRFFFWHRAEFICKALGYCDYELTNGAKRECIGPDVYAICFVVKEHIAVEGT